MIDGGVARPADLADPLVGVTHDDLPPAMGSICCSFVVGIRRVDVPAGDPLSALLDDRIVRRLVGGQVKLVDLAHEIDAEAVVRLFLDEGESGSEVDAARSGERVVSP